MTLEKDVSSRQWLSIFQGEEKQRIWEIIRDIAGVLRNPPPAWIPFDRAGVEPYRLARGANLAVGSSGIALFYAYLARMGNEFSNYADEPDRFLSLACDYLEVVPMKVGLYRGISGIAWVVHHLQGLLYEDDTYDPDTDPNTAIDRILLEPRSLPDKFDLWEGCVGLGVYGLERFPHPLAEKLLKSVINRLDQLAVHDGQGLAWFTPPDSNRRKGLNGVFSNGYYDLGVAHGIAGVISFLAAVHHLNILPDVTGKLLEGAVTWLFSQQWDNGDGSMFPQYILPPDNKAVTTGTYGFCHGDLGMAAALLSASECVGNTGWMSVALESAHASVNFLNNVEYRSFFPNPHLCHGTAGLGHMFNRIYQTSKVPLFKDEACKWFRLTLELRMPGTAIAGFSKRGLNEEGELSELYDPGFIQGAAGIGLALMGAVSGIVPEWDRVMSISSKKYSVSPTV